MQHIKDRTVFNYASGYTEIESTDKLNFGKFKQAHLLSRFLTLLMKVIMSVVNFSKIVQASRKAKATKTV